MAIDMATSMAAEEDNLLCLSAIITNVASKAVKVKFDKVFPPSTLAVTILQNKVKLDKLKAEGRLNSAQYKLLFQTAAGATSSDTYDSTLMILLIRNLSTTVPKPIKGFDCLPSDIEISDEADLARIKHYRNKICHSGNNKISSVDFSTYWKCVTEAIVRLGGSHFKTECEDIRRKIFKSETKIGFTTMDTCVLEDSLEIYRRQESNFICSCHDSHRLELANWEKQDKLFVETTAVKEILKTLENQSTITVIGRPGAAVPSVIAEVSVGDLIAGASFANQLINPERYVTCKIVVHNYTKFDLTHPSAHIDRGYLDFPPVRVKSGHREMFVARKTRHTAAGTYGTATWLVEEKKTRVVVMWSCPFNFFYKNRLAVGLTSENMKHDKKWFNKMYYEKTIHNMKYDLKEFNNDIKEAQIENDGKKIKVTGIMGTGHQATVDISVMSIEDEE